MSKTAEFRKEDILGKRFERSLALTTREMNIDEEARTVELAFSSNEPVYHWFGYCKLDHSKSSIRLDRLEQTGALLWAHDSREQIGAVESVMVEENEGKCRAIVKFSKSECGEENFQDVKDGIKRSVSFGFMIHALEPEVGPDGKHLQADDGEYVYVSRDWEPFEISLVSIPADISVGVGRSLDTKDSKPASDDANSNHRKDNEMKSEKDNPAQPDNTEPEAAAAAPVQSTEVARVAEFAAFGEQFGEVELARDLALDPAKTLNDVRQAILAKRQASQPNIPASDPEDVAARQGGKIEIAHSVFRGGALKAFKGPKAHENAYRSGMALLAALEGNEKAIRFCRDHGIQYNRTQTGKDNAKGGFFVIPEFESSIIDLRIMYGAIRANANVVPMATDTKIYNRRTGGLTAYPVGPGGRGTKSTANWDQVELIARKWMVLAKMEDELEEDSVISFADTLANEAAYAFTFAEDDAGFNGDGSSTYHGIVGVRTKLAAATAGLQTASGNAWSEITMTDMLGVVGKLPQFARKSGNVKWYCTSEFWANVMQRLALAAGGVTHAEVEGELKEVFLGKPVEIVEVLPHTEANSQIPVLYGNLAQAATMGDRRGVTIKTTDSNDVDFESDIQTLKATERFDIVTHDVGNTSVAGPIVGLITAGS